MVPSKKKKLKLIILLVGIWFVIILPFPWIINNPNLSESALFNLLPIIAIMSVPFVVLGVVWTLKPELTT
ncbi:MAG: hypothetical protein IIA81_06355 [Thaumarchaeota archaeon]|nr:hypothetical protein [Nitrososphaerota archaeon]MCH8972574.1 hypothetical protein [Nitrososphaerota archaeon]